MSKLSLGRDEDYRKLFLDTETLRKHMHLIGASGSGKSNAILTLLRPLMLASGNQKNCIFVIDPLGTLSADLLKLMAHPRYMTDSVRRRLVYIEPANESIVLPFNPLTHSSTGRRYYQVMRAIDIVLRAWDAQDVSQQPRLLQWMYKAFCVAATMDFPISMCRYLLHPGTAEHKILLDRIPGEIRHHWQAILKSQGQAQQILESTRNRLDPFFESDNLRRMFSARQSRFDCEQLIRDKSIVILNLARDGILSRFIAQAIGGLFLNEIFETASRMVANSGRSAVDPCWIVADEFQHYVNPDIEDSIPVVRNFGLRLILAHQSFSQLERNDVDLTQMIWQAQTRLAFASSARDADTLADELAKLTFDSKRVKHEQVVVRQLIAGYRKEWLESYGSGQTFMDSESHQSSNAEGSSRSRTDVNDVFGYSQQFGSSDQISTSNGTSRGSGQSTSQSRSQANVPIHVNRREVNPQFESFEEWSLKWGQDIRKLKTGEAFFQCRTRPDVAKVKVDHLPIEDTNQLQDAVAALKEQSFSSDIFISAAEADREAEACRLELFAPPKIKIVKAESKLDEEVQDRPSTGIDSDDGSPFSL